MSKSSKVEAEVNFKMVKGLKSSNLKGVGYDADLQKLLVEFKYGGVYVYNDVPQGIYDNLVESESIGSYLAKNIKNVFEFDKVK